MIDKNEIIKYIQEYIQEQGNDQDIWHIHQCEDPHGVVSNVIKRTSNNWMYIETGSGKAAKYVLDFCINTLDLVAETNKGFGTNKGSIIYIYKKLSKHTI